MVFREYSHYSNTPEEKECLARKVCPHCGCERLNFNFWNMHAICCISSCSTGYWDKHRSTISEMQRLVHDEQEGKCTHYKKKIHEFKADEYLQIFHYYVMDHIQPIAVGGDQWAPG